jgi:hypothetical protein
VVLLDLLVSCCQQWKARNRLPVTMYWPPRQGLQRLGLTIRQTAVVLRRIFSFTHSIHTMGKAEPWKKFQTAFFHTSNS